MPMKIGDFVEWNLIQFEGVQFTPSRGFIIHLEGDWAVVRCTAIRAPACPFVTIRKSDLAVLEQIAVHPGAYMIG